MSDVKERPDYMLDGIRTAMTWQHPEYGRWFRSGYWTIRCPCGYGTMTKGLHGSGEDIEHHARLRFHYTHCPQAKSEENGR